MTINQPKFTKCGTVRRQAICSERLRHNILISEQSLQQFQCSFGVAPLLHDQIEGHAFVIDCAPQIFGSPPILQTISSRCQHGDGVDFLISFRLAAPNSAFQQPSPHNRLPEDLLDSRRPTQKNTRCDARKLVCIFQNNRGRGSAVLAARRL